VWLLLLATLLIAALTSLSIAIIQLLIALSFPLRGLLLTASTWLLSITCSLFLDHNSGPIAPLLACTLIALS
jgi:hypothetical protein